MTPFALDSSSGEVIHRNASKIEFSAVGLIHDSHSRWFGSLSCFPGGCILHLSLLNRNQYYARFDMYQSKYLLSISPFCDVFSPQIFIS